ncbi:hypothetical protein BWQ96_04077 [Gracilariopsis chorda]|uniref:Uncharacterized protein n=1 Tax=Gracilariopsis chorda TaxID=448386 RepID=A0A2V3IYI9_9FLOR|nr:hypothetical protein BWQ96_04077 [Gracilariopsis chorda]|eukprot:PXF46200.1 hypothetical protein BWQ96_04077 [Gracilariopsis chorda]
MVKKVLSVLCVATIIGSATAGVLLCLRRRKGKGQGKTAEEAEGNRAAAGGRVDAENIRIGDVLAVGPVEVAVENAVDGDKDGSKESTGVAFQEPDANYAFSAGAIPVLGVTSGSRTFDERTRWGSAAAAASNVRVAFIGTSARSVPIGRDSC